MILVSAQEIARPALAAGKTRGDFLHQGHLLALLAEAALLEGDHVGARDLAERARALAVPSEVFQAIGWRMPLVRALVASGELDEAKRLADEATAIVERTDHVLGQGQVRLVRAEVLAALGRADAALAEAEDGRDARGEGSHAPPRSSPVSGRCAPRRGARSPGSPRAQLADRRAGNRHRRRSLDRSDSEAEEDRRNCRQDHEHHTCASDRRMHLCHPPSRLHAAKARRRRSRFPHGHQTARQRREGRARTSSGLAVWCETGGGRTHARPPVRSRQAMRKENGLVTAWAPEPTVIVPRAVVLDEPCGTARRHVAQPPATEPRPRSGRPFTVAVHVAAPVVSGGPPTPRRAGKRSVSGCRRRAVPERASASRAPSARLSSRWRRACTSRARCCPAHGTALDRVRDHLQRA